MILLGINSAYHEPAAAILVDGRLEFFVEEERINRFKHGKPALVGNPHILPEQAIQACLKAVGCTLDDVDAIGFSFAETGRLKNIGADFFTEPGNWGTREGEELFHQALMKVPGELEKLGKKPIGSRFKWVPHHFAHASSAYLCSPFEHSLILAIDGIGEFDSLLMAHGKGNAIHPLMTLPYPHSLGFLWEKICQYLGFSEYDACKVMGLASYGDPDRFRKEFGHLATLQGDGTFTLSLDQLRFRSRDCSALTGLFGPGRAPTGEIQAHHQDVAATLQRFTEEAVLGLCRKGKELTGAETLCLSGGVALNCQVNARIQREGMFKTLFVQPAANDAGTALGAASYLWCHEFGRPRQSPLEHAYWGPGYTSNEIEAALKAANLSYKAVERPAATAANLLAEGKIVGWFQGRMEMGPRALGNRSLLADPRRADMREILNRKIKHREPFRPFAPSVLHEKAGDWFDIPGTSPSTDFMLFTYKAKPGKGEKIPAVIHVDSTSRIQTVRKAIHPLYHELIASFETQTGVPMVLNTSFNDSEPIVMSPENALRTFQKTGIDAVILDRFLVEKR